MNTEYSNTTALLEKKEIRKQDWYSDIVNMMERFGQEVSLYPHVPDENIRELRVKLIEEEVGETLKALENNDLVELADGIVDSIVVLLGCAVAYGIDVRPVWDIIHKSNMAKADGPIREDGKRLKPEGWVKPDVKGEIYRQIDNVKNTSSVLK